MRHEVNYVLRAVHPKQESLVWVKNNAYTQAFLTSKKSVRAIHGMKRILFFTFLANSVNTTQRFCDI